MKTYKNKKGAVYLGAEAFKNLIIPITIVASAIFLFGATATWAIFTNFKVIIWIVGGIIAIQLLKLLGFKKK